MAKLALKFKGFEDYISTLQELGANVKEETEKALLESGEIINNALHEEMKPHHVTGQTEKSIIEPKVSWSGTKASMRFGFDYKKAGLAPVFLERGRLHQKPTPVLKPALKKSDKEIKKQQEEALKRAIERAKK